MRIFVTGLCLQGNKGGPALAASLLSQLREQFDRPVFTIAVPALDLAAERAWAPVYGVEVVPEYNLFYGAIAHRLGRPFRRQQPDWAAQYRAAFRGSDLVVDLSGVSYVGAPIGRARQTLMSTRFKAARLARAYGIPFLAWTQSYGPFGDAATRCLARADLVRLPTVYCRGADCAAAVRALLPRAQVADYPDVAVTLPWNADTGSRWLHEHAIDPATVVTISPSAVIHTRLARADTDNPHVTHVRALCKALRDRALTPLLVPHTLRPGNPAPNQCDHAVCRSVREAMIRAGEAPPAIVDDDLSPMDLKSIISRARLHVGARYHSLIAALSAGVPSIALSWHPKYLDALRQYAQDDCVLQEDTRTDFDARLLQRVDTMLAHGASIRATLLDRQPALVARVRENATRFREDHERLTR